MLPDDLSAALGALRDRRPDLSLDVRWHASVPSTMDVAAALAADGAAHGVVVGADEQTRRPWPARARRGSRRPAPDCTSRSSRGRRFATARRCRW